MRSLTDSEWQAVVKNDPVADGEFIYGVLSTGIFCRPSCPSRLPKRDHVRYFHDPAAALQAGLRPCKRCRPTGDAVSLAAWVTEIERIIERGYAEPLSLTEIAQRAHGAPHYLHHVFHAVTGQTPLAYLQRVRLAEAKRQLLTTTVPVKQVALACGFSSAGYFSTVFKREIGQTPRQFRHQ